MRRKHLTYMDKAFENMDDCFEYVKRIKDINGNQIAVEISETTIITQTFWFVEVWKR